MIRAIALDLVGTLLFPEPSVSQVYSAIGKRFGSRLDLAELKPRFEEAFRRQDLQDRAAELMVSESRERQRWQTIVAEVLHDVADSAGCFEALYHHFSLPEAWRLEPDAAEVLPNLAKRGYKLALATNYDHRLHSVRAGFPALFGIDAVLVSAEVGWRKPSPRFYSALGEALQLPANEIVMVGDDEDNDFQGAQQAGLQAIHYDPQSASRPAHIRRLRELLDYL